MLLDINDISNSLAEYLGALGLVGGDAFRAIYADDSMPVTKLPESFLKITGNGSVATTLTKYGVLTYNLALVIGVKLNPDGTKNSIRETHLLQLLEDNFVNTIEIGRFYYSLNKGNIIYSSKDLISGYSLKIININVKIF